MFNSATYKKGIVYFLLTTTTLFLAACGTTTTAGEEGTLPPEAVLNAQAWLADELGVAVEDVEITNTEQMEWTDSCLGLGGAAEICAAVITPGWLANFEVNGQAYEVRLDETGATIRSPQIAAEPPALENE